VNLLENVAFHSVDKLLIIGVKSVNIVWKLSL